MSGPLEGLKILDFTILLPGPFATMTLADLGAEVLSISSPGQPDPVAEIPPSLPNGVGAATAWLGRNKKTMSLNLNHSAAKSVVSRLLESFDVVIEQFRPGVMARFGLDYQSLKKNRPGLIYCSLTGYGQDGPLSRAAGHDINYLARSGLMGYSGRRGQGPSLIGIPLADLYGGSSGVVTAILAAVIHRQNSGQGQYLDVSMTDGAMACHGLLGASYLSGGPEPQPESELLNGGALYDFYQTADGRWLAFGGLEPKFSAAFFTALGRPDLIPAGASPPNPEKVKPQVAKIIKGKTLAEWMEVFEGLDACVEPVLSMSEALGQEHAKARGMVIQAPLGQGGFAPQIANPLKFSRTPAQYRHAGRKPGSDTKRIMRDLGYSDEQIGGLGADGLFD